MEKTGLTSADGELLADGNCVIEGLSKQKLRNIRRKQFFSFFEGFFDRNNNESAKLKNFNMSFTDEEKKRMLKRYF